MVVTREHSERVLQTSEKVRELFLSLAKLISAKTIYAVNNPTLSTFEKAFNAAFRTFFDAEKELVLGVEQYRLLWRDQVVYENSDRNGSVAFMFYKDGVGELTIHATVTATELEQFVDIIKEEIHNPTPDSDIVTRLWKADFANIAYRVLDEDPTGESDGERGSGARSRAAVLQADDHGEPTSPSSATTNDRYNSIADYLLGVVAASRPTSTVVERECFVQEMFASLFCASAEETRRFNEELGETERADKIALLLETALDFVTGGGAPSMVENAICLAQRSVGFAKEESNPRTLARLLTLLRQQANDCTQSDVVTTLRELEKSLVDPEFLRSLAVRVEAPTEEVLGVARYCRQVGGTAIPVMREMLKNHQKPVVHREVCDAMLALAGEKIHAIIDELDIDDPLTARDVVYLLRRSRPGVLPPIVKELVHYPDAPVREGLLHLLVEGQYDNAPAMFAVLIDDGDPGIRRRALAAVVNTPTPAAAQKVVSLCFDEDAPARDDEERMRLFEAAGRLAGAEVVERLGQILKRRAWHRFGRQAGKADKQFAIAALQNAGSSGRALLAELTRDSDEEVRTRAQDAMAALEGRSPREADE